MNIVVIGTGYVGLVSGTCFAELGNNVICIDKNKEKIDKLKSAKIPIYEPGLEELVAKNAQSGRLSFSDNLLQYIDQADFIFIAVGTPTNPEDGSADLSYIFQAASEIKAGLKKPAIIVTKSTVPVGTGKKIAEILPDCHIASNPEFLREGSAIEDFMNPDRVIIGTSSNIAKSKLELLYSSFSEQKIPIITTSIETAELTKYAANAFLATKIAFINEMADLCEKLGADIDELTYGMGLDHRISYRYLKPGPGFGGSCFPKDTLAIAKIARDIGSPTMVVESVIASNENRKKTISRKLLENMEIKGKIIAVLGLAFKAGTDDMRYSAALDIIPELLFHGAIIHAYDPAAMENAKILLIDENIHWMKNALEAVKNADAAIIITEWPEFTNSDLYHDLKILVDLRNIVDITKLRDTKYISIGK